MIKLKYLGLLIQPWRQVAFVYVHWYNIILFVVWYKFRKFLCCTPHNMYNYYTTGVRT